MGKTSFSMRIDEELKTEAEELFADFGMSLSTAVRIFLKQAVRQQNMPFAIKENIPNDETIKAIEDARKGIGVTSFNTVEELLEDLHAES
ncbi:MAG: type II toxin-antitoxin system RelB/DinJ family antitoxin [Bacteroides sp.]|nr:type II toxin-antitoxin system RelB/DinJ family antitoxin [Bacteroides sp.]